MQQGRRRRCLSAAGAQGATTKVCEDHTPRGHGRGSRCTQGAVHRRRASVLGAASAAEVRSSRAAVSKVAGGVRSLHAPAPRFAPPGPARQPLWPPPDLVPPPGQERRAPVSGVPAAAAPRAQCAGPAGAQPNDPGREGCRSPVSAHPAAFAVAFAGLAARPTRTNTAHRGPACYRSEVFSGSTGWRNLTDHKRPCEAQRSGARSCGRRLRPGTRRCAARPRARAVLTVRAPRRLTRSRRAPAATGSSRRPTCVRRGVKWCYSWRPGAAALLRLPLRAKVLPDPYMPACTQTHTHICVCACVLLACCA